MKFHFPSFLLGYLAGAGSAVAARRLRPVMVELASVAYRFSDAVRARVAFVREDAEDLVAEARARARTH